jgi:hypothetical protein
LQLRAGNKVDFNAFSVTRLFLLDGMAEVAVAQPLQRKPKTGEYASAMWKTFSEHSPDNFLNQVYLIHAERCMLQGKRDKALRKLELPIEHHTKEQGVIHEQGMIHKQALACERTGMILVKDGGEWIRP